MSEKEIKPGNQVLTYSEELLDILNYNEKPKKITVFKSQCVGSSIIISQKIIDICKHE